VVAERFCCPMGQLTHVSVVLSLYWFGPQSQRATSVAVSAHPVIPEQVAGTYASPEMMQPVGQLAHVAAPAALHTP
jgi:hypothetical protein